MAASPPTFPLLTRAHVWSFGYLWVLFAAMNLIIVMLAGDADGRLRRAIFAAAGTVLGPMTGAIARDWQSCCTEFGLHIMIFTGPVLALCIAAQFFIRRASRVAAALRLALWGFGWTVWFLSGLVSFAHAFG